MSAEAANTVSSPSSAEREKKSETNSFPSMRRHGRCQCPLRFFFRLFCLVFLFSMVSYVMNIQLRYQDRVMDYIGYYVMGTGIILRRQAAVLGDRWAYPDDAHRDSQLLASVSGVDHIPIVVPRTAPSDARLVSSADYACYQMHCQWRSQADGRDLTFDSGGTKETDAHLFYFFVPGNAGTWRQGQCWACALQLQSSLLRWSGRVHLFNFHFLEQASVHRGKLLRQQAMYVVDGVVAALADEGFEKKMEDVTDEKGDGEGESKNKREQKWVFYNKAGARAEVWLVGHSMGGIITELVAAEYLPAGTVAGLLTFNSPLRAPPLFLDRPMRDLYASLYQRRDRLPARVFTFTSSDLDLQIESRTTYYMADNLYLYNTNAASVCTRNLGHDDIMRDYCVMAFASEMVLAAATGNWSAEAYPTTAKGSALPPLEPPPWGFALWGRWCWQATVWPIGPTVYITYVLAEGTVPLARLGGDLLLSRLRNRGVLPTGATAHVAAATSSGVGRSLLWALIVFTTSPALLCALLFYASMLWQWLSPTGAAPPPWGWKALAAEVGPLRLLLLSLGPLASGILFGGVTVRLLFFAATMVRLVRVRLCDAVLTPPKRSLLFSGLVVLYWVAATLTDLAFVVRVVVWFVLSFFGALSIAQVEEQVITSEEVLRQRTFTSNSNSSSNSASHTISDRCVAAPRIIVEPNLVLMAFTFLMSLHTFFDFRNHIVDEHHIMDPMNYVVEVLLLLLFVLQGTLPAISAGAWRQLLQSRVSALFPVLTVATYVVALAGLAYVLTSPIELCNILPCMVCVTPAYVVVVLLSVASLRRVITPTGEWKLKGKK